MEYLGGLITAVDLALGGLAAAAAVNLARHSSGPALRWTVGLLAVMPLLAAVSRWTPPGLLEGWLWLVGSGAWLGAVYLLWQTGLLRTAQLQAAARRPAVEQPVRLEAVRAVACWPRRHRGE